MGFNSTRCSEKNDRVLGGSGDVVLKGRERESRRVTRGRFQRLGKIVPGGEGLEEDELMAQTAHYIVHLRMQLCALQALLQLHDS